MITKKLEKTEQFFIQFTDEELNELNIKKGQKFSIHHNDADNSLTLKPFATLEIDLADYNREILEFLIEKSVEEDISINEVICNILEENIKKI
jgi:hypothetical protein